MIGSAIKAVRKAKNISLTSLSQATGLNLGHLSHIEKGRRTPSLKSLESIAYALGLEIQDLFCYSELQSDSSNISEERQSYSHLRCSVPVFKQISGCVSADTGADFALKIDDDSLEPLIHKDSCILLKKCSRLEAKELGLFWKAGRIFCRTGSQKPDSALFLGKVIGAQ